MGENGHQFGREEQLPVEVFVEDAAWFGADAGAGLPVAETGLV
jgi:hypothetical protein